MARAADGDVAAQKAVTRRLMKRVRSIAKGVLSDPFDIDDATQIALLEILSSAGVYRAQSRLEVWADRISIRVAMRVVRDRKARQLRLDSGQEPDQLAARTVQPSLPETPRAIQDYLRELSNDRRTAFVLRHVFEYSLDEIAQLTGASRNTVKDRLISARTEVRRRIRRELLTGKARRTKRRV